MPVEKISVPAEWDPEARVWYVAKSSLFGLNAESATVDELVDKLPATIQDLLEECGSWSAGNSGPVSLEVTAHTTTLVHRDAA